MWFVYILLCVDGSLYTGSTNDLSKRFLAHQRGSGGAYTRSRSPKKIVFTQEFPNRSSAQRRESEIKKLSRSQKLSLIAPQS